MNRRDLLIGTAALAMAAALEPSLAQADGHIFPYDKQRRAIHGNEMAYVDHGTGRPVVFLHGNPTSSYLWRNIMPAVEDGHRIVAPDLIGMGDSAKPDIAYTYADHALHLHGLLDSLDLRDVVLVVHDWGSALGFDWAEQNRDRVGAIAYMEAMVPPGTPIPSYEAMGEAGEFFRALRTPGAGEQMVLEENFFIEMLLRQQGVITPLSDAVMEAYRAPFPTPESRRPTLQWPREIPIGGEPAHTTEVVARYSEWLLTSEDLPKLMFHVDPGVLIPPPAVAWLLANMPNLETHDLGPGVHYLQEDHPEEIGRVLAEWLTRV